MSEYICRDFDLDEGIECRELEQIVRCVDCKYGRSPQQGLPWMCIRNCCAHIPIEPDGFCAWGERRDA